MRTDSINEYEIMLLVAYIGLLESIRHRVISVEEAENYLLSPYSADTLQEMGVNHEISHLIYCGCELENIERLIPEEFDNAIQELMNKAASYWARSQNQGYLQQNGLLPNLILYKTRRFEAINASNFTKLILFLSRVEGFHADNCRH